VHGRAIAAAVIGEQALDADPVAREVRHGSPQEGDDGDGLLVGGYLGVGQARAVIDRDMPVRCGIVFGAEGRSSRPSSSSAR
jgi:hypothetical protein